MTDTVFLAMLSSTGILEAAQEIGIDPEPVFCSLALDVRHPYRRYRWSVGLDECGNAMIHALPPEEEMGWTPWERWQLGAGIPVHQSWVLYPFEHVTENGVALWRRIERNVSIEPYFSKQPGTFEEQLRRARIHEGAQALGLDFEKTFIAPQSANSTEIYSQFRWVVIPHVLAAGGPVIYALPPMNRANEWPWESWYTDGSIPLIHHVHYTKPVPRATGRWRERSGAPQRPQEVLGPLWYWYDDASLAPALAS